MNLDESQKKQVTTWIGEGLKLSEIQSRLAAESGLRLTYMEVRLLVDDLKLVPKDVEPPKPAEPIRKSAPAAPAATSEDEAVEPEAAAAPPASGGVPREVGGGAAAAGGDGVTSQGVSVTVDELARPGAVVSGKVTFSDGQRADWGLDQLGRLAILPAQPGYKPPATDMPQFQLALESELAKMGF